MVTAFVFSGVLLLIAVFSIYWQIENLKGLRKPNIPSDDRRYRRNQAVFRLINGVLLLGLGGMIAGAFVSGMEHRATELGNRHENVRDAAPPQMTDEDRDFLKLYSWYWISVLVGLFVVVSIAIIDLWATRLYAWAQLRRMQGEHRAVLERDLAVYRQQQLNNRMKSH